MKNLKKEKVLLVLCLVFISLVLGGFIGVNLMNTSTKEDHKTESVKKIKLSKGLSMMLETGAGTGEYQQTTRESWPTDGYKFNAELSKCENGGKLSWDSENNTVIMTGSTSDKCYVYFDKVTYLVDYVKSQYTGVQGENAMYLHNGTIKSGETVIDANDGSYRYAGGDISLTQKAINEGYSSDGVISYYCDGAKINLGDYCSSSTDYYTLNYDSSNTQYDDYNDVLIKAVSDGYATINNTKNFVCFGSNEEPCPHDNLYRIIGVFEDNVHGVENESLVKLVKWDYATSDLLGTDGSFSGDSNVYNRYQMYKLKGGSNDNANRFDGYFYAGNMSSTILSSSNKDYKVVKLNNSATSLWLDSELNLTNLNINYLNNIGTQWSSKIANAYWIANVHERLLWNLSVKDMYQEEVANFLPSSSHYNKVGLMYASDYGYAAQQNTWGTSDGDSYQKNLVDNNWLYFGVEEFLITAYNNTGCYQPCYINSVGVIYYEYYSCYCSSNLDLQSQAAVRPTFYLNSNVTYVGGDGSSSNPIRVN